MNGNVKFFCTFKSPVTLGYHDTIACEAGMAIFAARNDVYGVS
jgi:hypothetical protein